MASNDGVSLLTNISLYAGKLICYVRYVCKTDGRITLHWQKLKFNKLGSLQATYWQAWNWIHYTQSQAMKDGYSFKKYVAWNVGKPWKFIFSKKNFSLHFSEHFSQPFSDIISYYHFCNWNSQWIIFSYSLAHNSDDYSHKNSFSTHGKQIQIWILMIKKFIIKLTVFAVQRV